MLQKSFIIVSFTIATLFSFQALSFGKSVQQRVSLPQKDRELSSTDKKDCDHSKKKKMSKEEKRKEMEKQKQRAYIPLIPDGAGETIM